MASKEIYKSPEGIRLFGGLEWRVLDTNHSRDASLRITAKERASSHAVTVPSSVVETISFGKKKKEFRRSSGGFFVAPDEGEGPGKKAHSLAAAFALWARDHERAALYVHTETGKVAVVVVQNGLPSLDKVVDDESEAYAIVAGYLKEQTAFSVFADDIEKFPTSLMEHGLLESIAAAAEKATVIKPIPLDVARLAIVGVVLISALGGYQFWNAKKAEQERRAAILRAQEADPVPKYLDALASQSATLGATRPSIAAAFVAAGKLPVATDGWKLKLVECTFGSNCVATYDRTTGTFDGLKKAVPSTSLDQFGSMNLNEGRLIWKQEMEADPLDVSKAQFPLHQFLEGEFGSQFQVWMVAGLGLVIQAPTLWPPVPEVPATFKHPQAVALGKLEVSNVPLPLVSEVIAKAPPNIIWSGFSMQIGDAKSDPMGQAKVKMTGSYYVQN